MRINKMMIAFLVVFVAACGGDDGRTVDDDPTIEAGVYCSDAIERQAQYASRWTNGFGERKFSRYRWENEEKTLAFLIGDRVEFQNGFGAWQPHWYSCEIFFGEGAPVVMEAHAFPGRMPGR